MGTTLAMVSAELLATTWTAHGGDMADQLDYVPIPGDVVGLVEKAWGSSIKLGSS